MIKVAIKDPIIKTLIVEDLLQQAQADAGSLERQGLDPNWIKNYLGEEARELMRASLRSSQYADVEFVVTISEAQINHAISRAADEKRVKQLTEYFVRHGASITMLRKMFKMGKHEIQAAKQLLSTEHKLGRPQMPSPFVREEVHQQWDKIVKANTEMPIREHLYLLHQAFQKFSLATLWQVINEFGPVEKPDSAQPKSTQVQTLWHGGNCVHRQST